MSSQGSCSELQEKVKNHEEKHFAEPFQPITEWFKLFLHIMNDDQLVGHLQKRLKTIVKDDVLSEEPISENLLERHSKRVQRNKK